jgi:hypothetical protein
MAERYAGGAVPGGDSGISGGLQWHKHQERGQEIT